MNQLTHEEIYNIVSYCAEEVHRQGKGPFEVSSMVHTWLQVIEGTINLTKLDDIKTLGYFVEPSTNKIEAFRLIPVIIHGGLHKPPPAYEVPNLMWRWCSNLNDMTPEEAYKEFQLIHPFEDGNGRVGKIIYNYLKKTMLNPILPPNFFGENNVP